MEAGSQTGVEEADAFLASLVPAATSPSQKRADAPAKLPAEIPPGTTKTAPQPSVLGEVWGAHVKPPEPKKSNQILKSQAGKVSDLPNSSVSLSAFPDLEAVSFLAVEQWCLCFILMIVHLMSEIQMMHRPLPK